MRRLSILLVGSALVLAIPGAASAALLFWDGTSKIRLGTNPIILSTGSGVATVNGSSGGLGGHLTTIRLAGGLANTQKVLLTDPNLPSVSTLFVDGHGGTGTLRPISGGGPLTMNTLPIAGSSKLCLLLAGCSAWLDIPLTQNGTKGLGVGGVVTVNGFGAGVKISLGGAPWTIATAIATGAFTTNAMVPPPDRTNAIRTLTGFAHGPTSGTSTAQIGGTLQYVTISFVDTTLMTPSNHITLWAQTRYVFVPEPGLVLLLASGVASLALLGRHRLRR